MPNLLILFFLLLVSPCVWGQDEEAVRAQVARFYQAWAAKNVDVWERAWSTQAPELAARKKVVVDFFAQSATITLQNIAINQVRIDGECANLRVRVNAEVIHAKTGKPLEAYVHQVRVLECVRENNEWKIWREASAYAELAVTLLAAKEPTERAALLAADKELVTPELARALRAGAARDQSRRLAARTRGISAGAIRRRTNQR
jgi:Cu/Ag efflux protein CusF